MSIVATAEDFSAVCKHLEEFDTLVVDVETNGLNAFGINQLCGVGVATSPDDSYYFPFRHQTGENLPLTFHQSLMDLLSSRSTLIGYNLKFDLHFILS